MNDYHGNAQLLVKVGVILRMSKSRPCGHKASSESMLFLDILEMVLIFFMALYDEFKAPCQVVFVFKFFWSFLGQKKVDKWQTCRNLHMVLAIVQI
jgi:hypothetical protein